MSNDFPSIKAKGEIYDKLNEVKFLKDIDDFTSMDFTKMEVTHISNNFLKIILVNSGIIINARTKIYSGSKLFRVLKVRNLSEVSSDSWFWALPKEKVTSIGRVNMPGESMLYTSYKDPSIAIKESRLHKGDKFILIEYELAEDTYFSTIGNINLPKDFHFTNNEQVRKNDMMKNFFDKEFTRIIDRGQEHYYKITNAINKILAPKGSSKGSFYGSIFCKNKYNLAIPGELARDLLLIKNVNFCVMESSINVEIDSASADFKILEHNVDKILKKQKRGNTS